jgi:hypothetical protein
MAYNPIAEPDETAFTAGASPILVPGSAVFNDALAALTSGQAGAGRQTPNRARHVNLRNQAGTELGTSAAPLGENLVQLAGTAIDVNSGNKSAGTQRVVLATDQPELANWRENVTYSGGAIKPRFVGNQNVTIDVTAGTSGTVIPALAGNYIYITAIQLTCSINLTLAAAAPWAIVLHDSAAIPWFNRMYVPAAFVAPGFATPDMNFLAPATFFYNSPNINTALTWSSTAGLTGGQATLLVWYGYTTLLF